VPVQSLNACTSVRFTLLFTFSIRQSSAGNNFTLSTLQYFKGEGVLHFIVPLFMLQLKLSHCNSAATAPLPISPSQSIRGTRPKLILSANGGWYDWKWFTVSRPLLLHCVIQFCSYWRSCERHAVIPITTIFILIYSYAWEKWLQIITISKETRTLLLGWPVNCLSNMEIRCSILMRYRTC